jgi:hypothetical protein
MAFIGSPTYEGFLNLIVFTSPLPSYNKQGMIRLSANLIFLNVDFLMVNEWHFEKNSDKVQHSILPEDFINILGGHNIKYKISSDRESVVIVVKE